MDNPSAPIKWEELRVPISSDPPASPSQEVPTVCIGQIGHDARGWTRLHYEALNNPELVQQQSADINTPGPGGVTPLMLAVTRKPTTGNSENVGVPVRVSTSSDSSNDSTSAEHTALLVKTKAKKLVNGHGHSSDVPAMKQNGVTPPFDTTVPTLIAAGAKLDATNDFHQTALHLAAASSRGDYVKQLLGSGANPNLQDNWGHTPLHTAIGACAEGAFMVGISSLSLFPFFLPSTLLSSTFPPSFLTHSLTLPPLLTLLLSPSPDSVASPQDQHKC